MHKETSMLAVMLEIRVKCRCHLPNTGDLTGLHVGSPHPKAVLKKINLPAKT